MMLSVLTPPVFDFHRVLEYDTDTKEVTVVMENLRFPNGIQLLPDEESVLVVETTMARIRRYNKRFGRTACSHSVHVFSL